MRGHCLIVPMSVEIVVEVKWRDGGSAGGGGVDEGGEGGR